MSTIALQPTKTYHIPFHSIGRGLQNKDIKLQDSEKTLSDREKTLLDINYFKAYVADLRAGKTVDNIHPDNDPYFLVPENIESLIRSLESVLEGKKGKIINRVEDLWEN